MEKEKKEKINELEKEKGTKTNKQKKWLILVIVCALILASVGGYFLYLRINHKGMFAGSYGIKCQDYPYINYCLGIEHKTSPRNHKIDTISIKYERYGLLGANKLKEYYKKYKGSCNYYIDSEGKVAQFVDESDRSWCMGSPANDHRAVTIAVASTTNQNPIPVSDETYKKLIDLIADICKRNDIEKLVWSDSKEDRYYHNNGANMTVLRDFSNSTDNPGEYLYSRMGDIADKVNDIINPDNGQNHYTDKTSNKKK